MNFTDLKISVVGLGALGGSLALTLKEKVKPKKLWGLDSCPQTLEKAKSLQIIANDQLSQEEILQASDLVFLCLYPKGTLAFLKENLSHFQANAILVDCTGIKEEIYQESSQILPEDLDLLLTHPLAGREFKGLDYACSRVFLGADFLLTPTPKNKKENLALIKKLAKELGFGRIIELNPQEHDQMIAFTSHLPHAIASSLVQNSQLTREDFSFGTSFQDATRVAYINSQLWTELFLANRHNLIKELDNFTQTLNKFRGLLLRKDERELESFLNQACKRKEGLKQC